MKQENNIGKTFWKSMYYSLPAWCKFWEAWSTRWNLLLLLLKNLVVISFWLVSEALFRSKQLIGEILLANTGTSDWMQTFDVEWFLGVGNFTICPSNSRRSYSHVIKSHGHQRPLKNIYSALFAPTQKYLSTDWLENVLKIFSNGLFNVFLKQTIF